MFMISRVSFVGSNRLYISISISIKHLIISYVEVFLTVEEFGLDGTEWNGTGRDEMDCE